MCERDCLPCNSPAQSGHGLNAVEEGGVLAGVVIALVIPGRDAVH